MNVALARRPFVTPVDVLVGVGWLQSDHVETWRHDRVPYRTHWHVSPRPAIGVPGSRCAPAFR
ncbi:MAG: hypothetical protein ACYDAQ_17535 [Mycobacteriales bacterium]